MSKFIKALVTVLAANLGAGVIMIWLVSLLHRDEDLLVALIFFAMAIIALIVQTVAGFTMLTVEKKKETGKGMLVGVGLILLIGLAVCGSTR